MKREHRAPEQIVRKIAEGERLLIEGRDVAECMSTEPSAVPRVDEVSHFDLRA